MITERIEVNGYEHVVHFTDTDFSAYIAIHSTVLGPAMGGCRVKPYADDAEALQDALLLSKGMSYKNSLAGLSFGGGKCVVNAGEATPELMRLVGQAIEHFEGQYISAEDVGTTVADMAYAAEKTTHIASLGAAGDPSPWTALGVGSCIERSLVMVMPAKSMPTIWIQGLGKVGWDLAERMYQSGYSLFVSDLIEDRVFKAVSIFGATPYQDFLRDQVDVYAPCAMGQIVTASNISEFTMPIICGSANNQLEHDGLGDRLKTNGVLYCPDFLVNAGGVIAAAAEITGFEEYALRELIGERGDLLQAVYDLSDYIDATPLRVALSIAESRWK